MTITADTNLLVRLIVLDDPDQTEAARVELTGAAEVVLATPALCEAAWVLRSRYRFTREVVADALESLLQLQGVITDEAAARAGVAALRAGSDFADAVIAELGSRAGADAFVSFDRKAVTRLKTLGYPARLVGA